MFSWLVNLLKRKPQTTKTNMNPALIALILQIVEQLVNNEPEIAAAFQKLFSGGTPTADDWAALRASIQTSFASLAPDADAAATLAENPPANSAGVPSPAPAALPAGHPSADIASNPNVIVLPPAAPAAPAPAAPAAAAPPAPPAPAVAVHPPDSDGNAVL